MGGGAPLASDDQIVAGVSVIDGSVDGDVAIPEAVLALRQLSRARSISLWIRTRGRVSFWAKDRRAALESRGGCTLPLPIIGAPGAEV